MMIVRWPASCKSLSFHTARKNQMWLQLSWLVLMHWLISWSLRVWKNYVSCRNLNCFGQFQSFVNTFCENMAWKTQPKRWAHLLTEIAICGSWICLVGTWEREPFQSSFGQHHITHCAHGFLGDAWDPKLWCGPCKFGCSWGFLDGAAGMPYFGSRNWRMRQ